MKRKILSLIFFTILFGTSSANLFNDLLPNLGFLGTQTGLPFGFPKRTFDTQPTIPDTFDARTQWPNCISPIRDQKSCGSCWAFASTSVLTDRFCIASNNTIKRLLSPQHMVNCDKECRIGGSPCDNGCNGGYMDLPWQFFENEGVVGETCVSYTAQETSCPAQCDNGNSLNDVTRFKVSEYYQLDTVKKMQTEILLYGPIASAFIVYEDFNNYKSGVYKHTSGNSVGGHAIRILGWGSDNGNDFWLVANSWGEKWGENGYFRIARGTDECDIESNAVAGTPITKGISNEYEPYEDASSSSFLTISPVISSLLLVMALFM